MEDPNAMNRRHALIAYILIACTLVLALIARASDTRTGSWTISHSDEPGKVSFALIYHSKHNNSNHESDWPTGDFKGVDFSKSGKQDVKFVIARDAGRFDCEGYLKDGDGAGVFHFVPDAQYVSQMSALGFTGIDADKLVAFRIHGVTPEMVSFLQKSGYHPDEDTLVAMRIHGVSPEYMQQLKKDGYDHIDLEKLIAFRIHGVSPDFIEKVQTLGYRHPEPDQLVAMRIHGVSPEFIAQLKSRGMKDLTIDQLVSLRIHGID